MISMGSRAYFIRQTSSQSVQPVSCNLMFTHALRNIAIRRVLVGEVHTGNTGESSHGIAIGISDPQRHVGIAPYVHQTVAEGQKCSY